MLKSIKQVFLHVSKPTKMALIVRGDIKMTKGKTAAQCAHASILCYETSLSSNSRVLQAWCSSGQPKIVLKVDNYEDLETIYKQAKDSGVVSELVRDAGRTQLSPGTVTVMGLGPDHVEKIDKLVKQLKLL